MVAKSVAALLPMIAISAAPLGFVQRMKSGLPESPTCSVPVVTFDVMEELLPDTDQPFTVAIPIRGLCVPSGPRP